MNADANCTIAVYRGDVEDGYGDPVADNTTPTRTGVPAALTERTKRVVTPDQPTPRIVRWHACRVSAGSDIRANDRVRNEQTGALFLVDAVSSPTTGHHAPDMLLDLRQVA